jgi:prolyl-tRNA synthetase
MPVVVVVGRGWANGTVEIRDRFTGEATEVASDTAVDTIVANR